MKYFESVYHIVGFMLVIALAITVVMFLVILFGVLCHAVVSLFMMGWRHMSTPIWHHGFDR
jgi:hypothetical protein